MKMFHGFIHCGDRIVFLVKMSSCSSERFLKVPHQSEDLRGAQVPPQLSL